MSLALLVWVGDGLLKRVLYFFGNEPSLGRKSPMLHLPLIRVHLYSCVATTACHFISICHVCYFLCRRNTHHVPYAKIKLMLERFEHTVTVQQLIDKVSR